MSTKTSRINENVLENPKKFCQLSQKWLKLCRDQTVIVSLTKIHPEKLPKTSLNHSNQLHQIQKALPPIH